MCVFVSFLDLSFFHLIDSFILVLRECLLFSEWVAGHVEVFRLFFGDAAQFIVLFSVATNKLIDWILVLIGVHLTCLLLIVFCKSESPIRRRCLYLLLTSGLLIGRIRGLDSWSGLKIILDVWFSSLFSRLWRISSFSKLLIHNWCLIQWSDWRDVLISIEVFILIVLVRNHVRVITFEKCGERGGNVLLDHILQPISRKKVLELSVF